MDVLNLDFLDFFFKKFLSMSDVQMLVHNNDGKKKRGRPKTDVWEFFKEGPRNRGHCSAECNFCGWTQVVGQPNEMQGHIALSCSKAPHEVKTIFLEKVKNIGKLGYENNKNPRIDPNQPMITEKFESTKVEQSKIEMANRAVVRFFSCCGIPFHVVENPFFVDLLCTLCPGYHPPSRNTLTESMLNSEISHVITEINIKISGEKNITLGVDGWTSPRGQSLYAFILITKERKHYLHSVKNLSNESNTGQFLSEKITEVIEDVGVEKFSEVVSNNTANMVLAKKLVNEKFNHIMPIRCIAHHINLLTTDICKLEFARSTLKKCMKLVRYFKASHRAGEALRDEIKDNMIGGGLKGYCQTRWTTAFDCVASVLKCEEVLKNVSINYL